MTELCAILLSFRNESTVLAALDSLLAQDLELDVVAVHSGGGPTPELVRGAHPEVQVVASPSRLTPGAARNAGLATTRAPFVSFLAADCRALPGWAAGRIRRHRAGAAAVASAMVADDGRAASLASHLLQHSSRMPHLEMPPPLRFGMSYARDALARHGPFPEELDGEEDVVLNARLLAAGVEIAWAPDVRTAHAYPRSARALFADQYRRGRTRAAIRGPWRPWPLLAGRALLDGPAGLARASRAGSMVEPGRLARAAPLTLGAAVATAAGVIAGRPR